MNYEQFDHALRKGLPVGTVLANPGKGTSTVLKYADGKVAYKRGGSTFYVSVIDLHQAYCKFAGKTVCTTELKEHAPQVFDTKSKGHDCHATFLFMALKEMGVVPAIEGTGRRGDPFRATVAER